MHNSNLPNFLIVTKSIASHIIITVTNHKRRYVVTHFTKNTSQSLTPRFGTCMYDPYTSTHTIIRVTVKKRQQLTPRFGTCMYDLSPCLACIVPKPQPTPPRNDPGRFLQAYLFPWKILNIINIRIELIGICTMTYRRDSCMKGLGSARRRSWG